MQTALIPPNEEERLKALLSYDILDTPEESAFDDLVNLAAYICNTPIAVISMVDKDRQWFKSKIGLDAVQTPRDISFCSHALHRPELFVISDATKDKRFNDNPLVTGEPNIRFYAGSPLITPTGQVIGTLCVIDRKVRRLRDDQFDTLRTLSRQVIAQMELRRTNSCLQEANKQLAEDQELLNRASRHKTYFLSKMSHEIRTPLNGILGMAELLQTSSQNQQQRHYTQVIANSGRMLNKLINDVLDFSAMDNNKLRLEKRPFELESTITSVTDMFRFRSVNRGVTLIASIAPDTPKYLVGDGPRIQQILINFIANAFKFTPEGEITVRLRDETTKCDNGFCRLECLVKDTGVGIHKNEIATIFDSPLNSENSSHNSQQGIGLSICRQLVELMGGDIGAYNNPDKGSTFWFRVSLPYANAEQKLKLPNFVKLMDKKVLIIDSNVAYGEVVYEQAKSWGMQAHYTCDSNEAMSLIYSSVSQSKPFDLIVIAQGMPGISGMDISSLIQQNPTLRSIPRLLLANSGPLPTEEQLFNAGIFLARVKPATVSQLNRDFANLTGVQSISTPQKPTWNQNKPSGRVLVADDNPVNRMVLEGMLEKLSLPCCLVDNGQKAFEEYSKHPDDYQLILMDCDMPVMDGYDATEKIRLFESQQQIKPIGIIAITAHQLDEEDQYGDPQGMNECVHKPIRIRDIERLLMRWNRENVSSKSH